MIEISFIIPVYNTNKDVLIRCFDSIKKIEDVEYEVVIVDDGSENEVGEFCKYYSGEYPQFKYFYQVNGGVGSARNVGVKQAAGRWIFFVDSDDIIEAKAFNKEMILCPAELVLFDYIIKEGEKVAHWHPIEMKEGEIDKKAALSWTMNSVTLNGPWAKMYCKDIILKNKLEFDENMINGEDLNFVLRYIDASNSIYYSSKIAYYYYRCPDTFRLRIIRNPLRVLMDMKVNRDLKLLCIKKYGLEPYEILIDFVEAGFVKGLFSKTCELITAALLTSEEKVFIHQCIDKVEFQSKAISRAKMEYYLMKYDWWLVIFWLAKIRRIYLQKRKSIK